MTGEKRLLDRAYTFDHQTSTEQTRALYDEWADVYDQELLTEQGYAMPRRCADALARFTDPPGTRVLDVGCGTGLSGDALRSVGVARIDGCDLSTGMLDRARALNLYERLFVADLTQPSLPLAGSVYDAVTAVGVYSFGHLHADSTETLLNAVGPGGLLVIGVNDKYYAEGSLIAKLRALDAAGTATLLLEEHGEHIPGKNVAGWVFVLERPS